VIHNALFCRFAELLDKAVNTGVKVHQRTAVKFHQWKEDGGGIWLWKGEREGDCLRKSTGNAQ
jgi:hypothetical protein